MFGQFNFSNEHEKVKNKTNPCYVMLELFPSVVNGRCIGLMLSEIMVLMSMFLKKE